MGHIFLDIQYHVVISLPGPCEWGTYGVMRGGGNSQLLLAPWHRREVDSLDKNEIKISIVL